MERELLGVVRSRPASDGELPIPAPGNIGLGVTGISPKGIAGVIEEEHAKHIGERSVRGRSPTMKPRRRHEWPKHLAAATSI